MIGPGPLPRSGPGPAATLGLARATPVGTVIGVPVAVGPPGVDVAEGDGLGLGDGLGDWVGLAVGGVVVGGSVGGRVGGGVGRGVGVGDGVGGGGVAVVPTTIVPVMNGWIEQWYAYVPAVEKATVTLVFAGTGLSNAPLFAVAV
jgi:hypothetical protein